MTTATKLHPKYITKPDGSPSAIILPVKEYDQLIEATGDLAVAAERINEPSIPHTQVVCELKDDGYLSD